jgi:hypothetical protein
VAAIPWQFVCATTFTVLVYWMPFSKWDISDDPEAFFYAICSSLVLMLNQEAINWCLIEVFQSDMLATTAAMTVLGMFFLLAGFFIKIVDMPWGVRWMAYMVPTKYLFPGQLFNFFDGETFEDPEGNEIPGAKLVNDLFDIDYDGGYRKWMDLLIGLAFVAGFRFGHLLLLKMKNGDLGGSLPTGTGADAKKWTPPASAHDIDPATAIRAKPSADREHEHGPKPSTGPTSDCGECGGVYPDISDQMVVSQPSIAFATMV